MLTLPLSCEFASKRALDKAKKKQLIQEARDKPAVKKRNASSYTNELNERFKKFGYRLDRTMLHSDTKSFASMGVV